MTVATDAAANATLTGVSAMLVGLLGVEAQAIVWSFVGCILGVTLAKPSGRFYAMALFVAATLACALLGTLTADQFFAGSKVARNVAAVVFGAGFHPILAAFISAVPGIVTSFLARRSGGQ
jgi:hypothetical protein